MSERHHISGRALAELVTRLGWLAYGEGYAEGLTPAQWTALRYFTRANRFSRTVSAFAEFHATTRGTASQTVKSLVAQGYLSRTPSETDGRSVCIDLTDNGEAVLTEDPFAALVRAATALPSGARSDVANILERILGHIAGERGKRPFGSCPACAHLRGEGCLEGRSPYECALVGEPLTQAELEQLCVKFHPARNSAMKRAYGGVTLP